MFKVLKRVAFEYPWIGLTLRVILKDRFLCNKIDISTEQGINALVFHDEFVAETASAVAITRTERTHPVRLIFNVRKNQIIVLLQARTTILPLTNKFTIDSLKRCVAVSFPIHLWFLRRRVILFHLDKILQRGYRIENTAEIKIRMYFIRRETGQWQHNRAKVDPSLLRCNCTGLESNLRRSACSDDTSRSLPFDSRVRLSS